MLKFQLSAVRNGTLCPEAGYGDGRGCRSEFRSLRESPSFGERDGQGPIENIPGGCRIDRFDTMGRNHILAPLVRDKGPL